MTPMIDVVFLLLIFFVCTASFPIAEETLPVHLLASERASEVRSTAPLPNTNPLVIKLRISNQRAEWSIEGRTYGALVEVRRMLTAVAAIDARLTVILDVEADVPMSTAIDLYDACRLAGFTAIQFAVSEGA